MAKIDFQGSIRQFDRPRACTIAHNEYDPEIIPMTHRGEHVFETLKTGEAGITAKFTQPPCALKRTQNFVPRGRRLYLS